MGDFTILVEAITTASTSDLTLDDLYFVNCDLHNESADCLSHQFKCENTGMLVTLIVITLRHACDCFM